MISGSVDINLPRVISSTNLGVLKYFLGVFMEFTFGLFLLGEHGCIFSESAVKGVVR